MSFLTNFSYNENYAGLENSIEFSSMENYKLLNISVRMQLLHSPNNNLSSVLSHVIQAWTLSSQVFGR